MGRDCSTELCRKAAGRTGGNGTGWSFDRSAATGFRVPGNGGRCREAVVSLPIPEVVLNPAPLDDRINGFLNGFSLSVDVWRLLEAFSSSSF
jgi:hypothetical protein